MEKKVLISGDGKSALRKAMEDLKWWADTNEEKGVVYIPLNNVEKDIERIKRCIEQIN